MIARTPGAYPSPSFRGLLGTTAGGRPVRDFVPVLVERKARAVLGKPSEPKG
uniref:three-helix bundle dimerization domain-containing protein n=1 Tax=Streptomyces tabacisoli TaxID=3156398 RepID=UPI003EBD7D43